MDLQDLRAAFKVWQPKLDLNTTRKREEARTVTQRDNYTRRDVRGDPDGQDA